MDIVLLFLLINSCMTFFYFRLWKEVCVGGGGGGGGAYYISVLTYIPASSILFLLKGPSVSWYFHSEGTGFATATWT